MYSPSGDFVSQSPRVPSGPGFLISCPYDMKRILFFVDGFNVYHALDEEPKYHKYKWLDYSTLARRFISKPKFP
jgi:hypothetical protein